MSKKNFSDSIKGKGYYIALVLCAVAIGISGYLYYRHVDDGNAKLADQPVNQTEDHVAAVATQPGTQGTETPTEPSKLPGKRVSPLVGNTLAPYSMEALSYNATTRDWRVHNGVDIAAEAGAKVCAAADGTVYTVYDDESMGMTVVISHEGGYTTRYSSLAESVSVAVGERVTAGQTIGTVANTAIMETALGDHLHFAVSCNGQAVDPAAFLN